MTWVLLIGAMWLTVALLVGVLIGRSIRLADRKQEDVAAPNFVVDLTPPVVPQPATPGPVQPSIPTARASSPSPALASDPPREPDLF